MSCDRKTTIIITSARDTTELITADDFSERIPEIRAVPLINPGRGGFEELKVHFLMEKEQQQKERLLSDYLILMEIPVIGLGYDAIQIINAARYSHISELFAFFFFFLTALRTWVKNPLVCSCSKAR